LTKLDYSYRLDSGSWSNWASSTSTTYSSLADGSHTFEVKAKDGAGNEDLSPAHWTWNIDAAPPTVTIDIIPAYINIANVAAVSVTITSNEDGDYGYVISDGLTDITGSGIISSGTAVNLTLDLSSLAEGSVTADAAVEDAVGNVGYATQDSAFKDTVVPTLNKDLDGTEGANGWYTSAVTVTLTGDDPDDPEGSGSGLDKVEYNLNGGGWTTYTVPFDITVEGVNTLEHRAYDNAGNEYVLSSQEIKIAKTAPVVTITDPADGAYVSSPAIISGPIYEDNCLTSAEVRIQRASDGKYWNGGGWQTSEVWLAATGGGSKPDFTFSYDASGITAVDAYTITARATDCAGNTGTSSSVVCIILPKSLIAAGACPLDKDEGRPGQQFRLIFTQDPTAISTYKLTASNPGQFFYNIFYVGEPGSDVDLDITIPYPFVTQGATPIHIYSGVEVLGDCYLPLDEVGGFDITSDDTTTVTPNGSLGIALEDYDGPDDVVTLTISGSVPDSGQVYVIVHLDYGLKKTVGYNKDIENNAEKPITEDAIVDLTDCAFEVGGDMTDTQTIENENVFEHDPGFAGLITLTGSGNPVPGQLVTIYSSTGSLLATVTTDEDGFYFYGYKHKGKANTYTVEACGIKNVVTVKANGLVEVNFQIP